MAINQAVVFTKPLHHLPVSLTPVQLGEEARSYLEARGLRVVLHRQVSGEELAARGVIREHYVMYSRGSYGNLALSEAGCARFTEVFGRDWEAERTAGRVMGNPALMEAKGLDPDELFLHWIQAKAYKLQPGMLAAWIEALGCFVVNAFYPAMEANFYAPETRIDYFVTEFDPAQVSWLQFRRQILGSTDASKADPASFRGRLFARFPVAFPGRDNFVHGSAGPFEGFIERAIHEADFAMESSPVGRHLATQGATPASVADWKAAQSPAGLGAVFDATEEKDTAEALRILDGMILPL